MFTDTKKGQTNYCLACQFESQKEVHSLVHNCGIDKPKQSVEEERLFTKDDMIAFSNYTNWNYQYSLMDDKPSYKSKGGRYTPDEVFEKWAKENNY